MTGWGAAAGTRAELNRVAVQLRLLAPALLPPDRDTMLAMAASVELAAASIRPPAEFVRTTDGGRVRLSSIDNVSRPLHETETVPVRLRNGSTAHLGRFESHDELLAFIDIHFGVGG